MTFTSGAGAHAYCMAFAGLTVTKDTGAPAGSGVTAIFIFRDAIALAGAVQSKAFERATMPLARLRRDTGPPHSRELRYRNGLKVVRQRKGVGSPAHDRTAGHA